MITTFYPPYNFGGDGILVQRLSNELARRGHLVEVIHCTDAYRLAASLPEEPYRDHPGVTVHGPEEPMGSPISLADTANRLPAVEGEAHQADPRDGLRRHPLPQHLARGRAWRAEARQRGQASTRSTTTGWSARRTPSSDTTKHRVPGRPVVWPARSCQKRPPQAWRYSRMMANALRSVDAFIAPSLTSQRKHEQLGISGRIVHIPNFVSAGENGSGRIANRRESDAPYFLFVGRLERLKGLHTVIPAFEARGKSGAVDRRNR